MELLLKRIAAVVIDIVLVLLPGFLIYLILKNFYIYITLYATTFKKVSVFMIMFFIYNFVMEFIFGFTIGKKIFKIRVRPKQEFVVNIFIRVLLKTLSIELFNGTIAITSLAIMIILAPNISLHDLILKTTVE